MTMAGLVAVSLSTMTFGVIPGVIPIAGVMTLVGFADGYGFTAAHAVVARAVPEQRQAAALGLMGAAEVAGAAVAALPAAWMYDSFGSGPTWAARRRDGTGARHDGMAAYQGHGAGLGSGRAGTTTALIQAL